MFVKVINYDVEEEASPIETIYQCGRVTFRDAVGKAINKVTGEDETFRDLLIEMEGCPAPHDDFLRLQCERTKLSVYVMNDAGKTVQALNFK